jgi:bacteriocin biosynthesis cyclodehydratase domain-containing protein
MLVLTAGRFGEAVGRAIVRRRPDARVTPLLDARDRLGDAIGDASYVAVALWRPYVGDCERLDALCAERGIRWSSAHVDGEVISCGPLVVPGAGPCYTCYRRRLLSHHKAADREMALRRVLENDPRIGSEGFVPAMVQIAAGALLEDADAPSAEAGRLRMVDVLNGTVLETEVIGVHGCPRCAPPGPEPGARFVEALIPELTRLLQ